MRPVFFCCCCCLDTSDFCLRPSDTPARNLAVILASFLLFTYSSVQSLSRVWLFATPWTAAHQAFLSITNSWNACPSNQSILPSHPLLSPSRPAFNLSQHQGLFQGISSLHMMKVAKLLGVSASASDFPMNIQDWFPLGLTGLILQSVGFSSVFSNTTVKSINSSVLRLLYNPTHIHVWLLEKP